MIFTKISDVSFIAKAEENDISNKVGLWML